jgi:hypothetical protein
LHVKRKLSQFTAGGVQLLAVEFLKDPLVAAPVLEAALSAAAAQLLLEGATPALMAGYGLQACIHSQEEVLQTLLALYGALDDRFAPDTNSSSSSSTVGVGNNSQQVTAEQAAAALELTTQHAAGSVGAKRQYQLSQRMASLLATCLKVPRATSLLEQQQQQQQHGAVPVSAEDDSVNPAALVADLCCRLGQAYTAHAQPAPAAGTAGGNDSSEDGGGAGSGSNSDSNSANPGSSSSSSRAVDRSRQWMALGARSLLLLCQWLQQLDAAEVQQGQQVLALLCHGDENSRGAAWRVLSKARKLPPLGFLVQICSNALDWLGGQLAAVGLPGLGKSQTAAAAQKAAEKLLTQQATALKKLQEAAAVVGQLYASSWHAFMNKAARREAMQSGLPAANLNVCDASGLSGAELQGSLTAAWQALEAFAGGLVAECPMPSICNNPDCTGFGNLSEEKLVGVKGTRCSGCKVARYC